MMHKVIRLFFDFEKEEKWLNEMSAMGLHFVRYAFPHYLFEEGTPGEYTYRLELLRQLPQRVESKVYINFLEETGVECIDTFHRWAYFRKKTSDGPFELYTDYGSRIEHYRRIMALLGIVIGLQIGIGAYSAFVGMKAGIPPVGAVLNAALAAFLARLFFSYRKRVNRMKAEAKLRE